MAAKSAVNFAATVERYLNQYGAAALDAVSEAVEEVSTEAVKKLRTESAAAYGSGEYSKGWTRTVERGRMTTTAIVHGKKPTYRLAHLLEYGHVSKNGTGRTFGTVPGRAHIEPVATWAAEEAADRIINKLEAI